MKSRYLLLLLVLLGCSPYKNNPLNNSYHDLTAHYNAYFIANERIKEIEESIFASQEWNYNKVLPIFPQFDTTKSASLVKEIEDCIQKASISIQRHPGSKWEDDSYILVGKARHYGSEFPDAIETFKYVNTHSENNNSRHQALTELIRSFVEFEEYNNAVAVTDYLAKEKLNNENKRRLFLNSAYLYQKKSDPNKMVGNLVKAEELLRSSDKARINFIIGQTYHDLGFESEAFRYYKNVLKYSPTYELEFYAKLYMAQVTELAKNNDLKKIERYFKSLLRDPKNKEYQDKIYYELAGFELNNGNLEGAIEDYKRSVRASTNNNRQKSYSYLSLGRIYYDTIKNFVLAKSYYDSTVSTMPKDEEEYPAIKERQEILVDFVKQVVTIHKNDSLLALAELPEDSLMSMASSIISKERDIKKKKKEKEKQAAINRARNISDNNNDQLIATADAGSIWYFDNLNQVAKGQNTFIRKWGDRPLEDDWRRQNKTANNLQSLAEAQPNISESTGEEEEMPIEEEARSLLAAIPQTEDAKATLLSEIEEALYALGNIYHLRLQEDVNAIESFETLLSRFPETNYEAEVLYQLYLLTKEHEPNKSVTFGQLLKSKYPDSIFAKLVDNPSYREESFAATSQLKRLYRDLYSQYKGANYKRVLFAIDSALAQHPENEFSDNIALLRVLTIGQTEEDHRYQFELGQFMEEYPESDVYPYAQSLMKASEDFQQERYNSAKARFIEDFNQKHFFVIVYTISQTLSEELPNEVQEFLDANNFKDLKTGNLILSDDKSMIFIDSFTGRGSAISFLKGFNASMDLKELHKGEKFDIFVITKDNFDIFYQTKDVSAYLTFFEKNY